MNCLCCEGGARRPDGSPKQALKGATVAGLWALLQGVPVLGQAAPVPCESLARLALPQTTITMARTVAAGEFKMPEVERPGPPPGAAPGPAGAPSRPPAGASLWFPKVDTGSLPAFCRVAATLKPSSDSDIKIEVWLPLSGWNGRFLGVGGGGTAGRIVYAGLPLGLTDALRLGYAAANTDAGHDASVDKGSLSFVVGHPEKLIDYAYRANHEMTIKAKAIVAAFYGVPAKRSLFIGCSLGSMQAINEAKRFPEDYDGVIAGALMNPIGPFNAAQLWPAWLIARDPAKLIPADKYTMIHEAALKACATPVGTDDGLIEEPDRCRFDPQVLLCKGAEAPDCLTAPQVELMRQIYAGPVHPRTGESIFRGPAPGAESELRGPGGSRPHPAALELFKYAVHQDPDWDWKTMDFDSDVALANKVLGPLVHVDANLEPFFDRGGKLMIYIGWNDYHNPLQVIDYYNDVLRTSGSQARGSIRLFNVPGMGHCAGGVGCDTFDKVGTMAQWLETGEAPEQILSSKLEDGKVVRTRPLCAYPKVARYKGTGNIDEGANFVCAEGAPGEKPQEGRR
jgi:feruloyl esterase